MAEISRREDARVCAPSGHDCAFSRAGSSCMDNIRLFADLPASAKRELLACSRHSTHPAGSIIVHEGDPIESIVVVRSGRIKTFRTSLDGKEYVLDVLHDGQALWHGMFLADHTYRYSVACLTRVELCRIHRADFEALMAEKVPLYERRFGVHYDIAFSEQKPSTDTVAVNPDNTLFRTDAGALLFRPAGHGALIENLNEIDADLVFVKNIDNVTTDARRGDTVTYKKVLAGLLLELQERSFEYIRALDTGGAELADIARFIRERLCVKLPDDYNSAVLRAVLDRPIRLCGMVRNEGEPGGGPFWAVNDDGTESLQIAESSQIAPADRPLMQRATHFNPVDLVCGVRNVRGEKFDLRRYTDPQTGFISSKSYAGRELRAQELPGLWNGAMARWNTVFVDVPVTTFSPVKVVLDLLRPQHQ